MTEEDKFNFDFWKGWIYAFILSSVIHSCNVSDTYLKYENKNLKSELENRPAIVYAQPSQGYIGETSEEARKFMVVEYANKERHILLLDEQGKYVPFNSYKTQQTDAVRDKFDGLAKKIESSISSSQPALEKETK